MQYSQIARSFCYGSVAGLICNRINLGIGLSNGLINAISSLFEMAVRRPFDTIMRYLGAEPGTAIYRICRFVMVIVFQMTAGAFFGLQIDFLASLVTTVALHLLTVPGVGGAYIQALVHH